MGAITGAIAEAYFGIPKALETQILDYLDDKIKKVVSRMIEKRNQVVKRYLVNTNSTTNNKIDHSRVTGADMDGFPDTHQLNAAFKYKGVLYKCIQGITFIKIDESNQSTKMNNQDFQFFVDEIRVLLHNRFEGIIPSVEDFYSSFFMQISNHFWNQN